MEISGTVIDIMAEVNGQGKNGVWRKQEFILYLTIQYSYVFARLKNFVGSLTPEPNQAGESAAAFQPYSRPEVIFWRGRPSHRALLRG